MRVVIFILTALMAIVANANMVSISKEKALSIVKQQMGNKPFDYYAASVDAIYDDGFESCDLSAIPDVDWLKGIQKKWLFFVDEQPMAYWSHKCTFLYVPQEAQEGDNVPVIRFSGKNYPTGLQLELLSSDRARPDSTFEVRTPKIKKNDHDLDWYLSNYFSGDVLVMIGGGYNDGTSSTAQWYDCSYFLDLISEKCNIIPGSSYFCFGGGPGHTYTTGYDSFEIPNYIGDPELLAEPIKSITKENVINLFKRIKSLYYYPDIGSCDINNLIVLIDCHGGIDYKNSNAPYLNLWHGKYKEYYKYRLYANELRSLLDSISSRYQTVILGNCYSGAFVDALKAPGRTILAACGSDELAYGFYDDETKEGYNYFVHYVTDAINGLDSNGHNVDADSNNDGIVSLQEAFNYANKRTTDAVKQKWNDEEHPVYCSSPAWVGQEMSLNRYVDSTLLFVRDNPLDSGNMRTTADINCWNSPDIWVRCHQDGLEDQSNEQIDAKCDTAYIYTRIGNLGIRDFNGGISSKTLELYWSRPSLTANDWLNNDNGGFIDSVKIDRRIAVDSSIVLCTPWAIPASYKECKSASLGNVSILARIRDNMDSLYVATPKLPQTLRKISNSRYLAEKNRVAVANGGGSEIMPLMVLNSSDTVQNVNIALTVDSLEGQQPLFEKMELYLTLSPSLAQNWATNGSKGHNVKVLPAKPNEVQLLGYDSKIEGLSLQPGQTDSVLLTCKMIASDAIVVRGTYNFNIVSQNSSNQNFGGAALNIRLDTSRPAINPGIDIGGAGTITGGDTSITVVGPINDLTRMMTATNIQEPVDYEWYDPDENLIATTKSVTFNNVKKGAYKLRVTAKSDGAVAYASADLSKQMASCIKSISPNPFDGQMTVVFNTPCAGDETICVTSVSGNILPVNIKCSKGDDSIEIQTSDIPSGQYLVSLLQNGKVVETLHATKK